MRYQVSKRDLELILAAKLIQLAGMLDAKAVPPYRQDEPICEYVRNLSDSIELLKMDLISLDNVYREALTND